MRPVALSLWWPGPLRVKGFFVAEHGPSMDRSSRLFFKLEELGTGWYRGWRLGLWSQVDVRAYSLSTAFYKLVNSDRLLFAHISK